MTVWLRGALALVLLFAVASSVEARGVGLQALEIVTATGAHPFEVEIANDDGSRALGLMNRRFMPADHGMLFEFDRDEPVTFWMKDTYIPLDMIFVSPDGLVTNIVVNAEPLSERTIPSGPPCKGVLELNGGAAARIGLKVGDRIRHPFFHS